MSFISAIKIYQNEQLIFNLNKPSAINGELVNNDPTQAYLVRNPYCCGGNEQWQLEFVKPTSMINVLTGVWIQVGADGFLIDGNVADVVSKLGGCCGTSAVVIPNYPTGLPAYEAPVAKTYTITHTSDDGSIAGMVDLELLYIGSQLTLDGGDNIVPNSFSRTAYNSGTQTGTYTLQAYTDPVPHGSDTIVETARVFTSNTYSTALSGANVYFATVIADGVTAIVRGSTTFASLVTALQADTVAGPMGTWSTASQHISLSTLVVDLATIVVGQEA